MCAEAYSLDSSKFALQQCVWCKSEQDISESHLIPESLGGGFKPYISCKRCNNFLGTKVEGTVSENGFLSAARSKLGIVSKKKAYGKATKVDTKTGYEITINKSGTASIIPKQLTDSQFIGSPKQISDRWVKKFERANPGKDSGPLKDFFDSDKAGPFSFGGTTHFRTRFPTKVTTAKIIQNARVDPIFVFKIAYEFLCTFGALSDSALISLLRGKFHVSDSEGTEKIIFDGEAITARVLTNTGIDFKDYNRLEDIPFLPGHLLILRVSSSGVMYVKICLFGQVKVFYIVGKLDTISDELVLLLDKVVILPLKTNRAEFEIYPTLTRRACVLTYDKWVDDTFRKVLSK